MRGLVYLMSSKQYSQDVQTYRTASLPTVSLPRAKARKHSPPIKKLNPLPKKAMKDKIKPDCVSKSRYSTAKNLPRCKHAKQSIKQASLSQLKTTTPAFRCLLSLLMLPINGSRRMYRRLLYCRRLPIGSLSRTSRLGPSFNVYHILNSVRTAPASADLELN
jgi:hypothetical protein